ncbi:MepB family protein [Nocardia sp. KC 131]|uniref:MepB family protein n=1 Tax=Nocardia arseniciresistens TaxID=3392119 RepID=UPI00398E4476
MFFPDTVLRTKDIVLVDGSGGKRGFRVYPPWADTANRQARATQTRQLDYFLHVPEDGVVDTLVRGCSTASRDRRDYDGRPSLSGCGRSVRCARRGPRPRVDPAE